MLVRFSQFFADWRSLQQIGNLLAIVGCSLGAFDRSASANSAPTASRKTVAVACTTSGANCDRLKIVQIVPIVSIPSLSSLIPPSTAIVPIDTAVFTPILAPNNSPAVPLLNSPQIDSRYILPPRSLAPQTIDPFATQFILNGDKISHLTPTVIKGGLESGSFRNYDFSFNTYRILSANTVQSVTRDSVVRSHTSIATAGIKSSEGDRVITTITAKPQTLLGVRQQISIDAACQDGSGRTCAYLPGVTIDQSNLDARTLQPTGAKLTSQFGDVISPATVAASRQPGFQTDANGNLYGIDLYLPALGTVTSPWSQTAPSTGSRREVVSATVAINYTQMEQKFATNGRESILGRTIRSLVYIDNDRHQLLNLAAQGLSRFLPELQPTIAPGTPGAKISVNPNIYRVANAIRLPDRSHTIYQSGIGYAIGPTPANPTLPGASYQSIWLGLSPVIDRQVSQDYYYVTRANPQIVAARGGEGGNLPVSVNFNNQGFNATSLLNPYAQAYVTVYNRNVDRYDISTIRQRTDYYPHVSLTGAQINGSGLWRYYTGAIATIDAPAPLKAYIGTDYSIATDRGLTIGVGGVAYLNPDPEHTSQLFAIASQSISLGSNPRHHLTVGANVNYIADGTILLQSIPIRTTQSYVNAGVAVNLGNISFGGTQFIGDLLPGSTQSKTVANIGWKVTDRLNVGAFYTLADRNTTTNPIGISASAILDPQSNSILSIGWNTTAIDFRSTLGTNANLFRDNTLSIFIRSGF